MANASDRVQSTSDVPFAVVMILEECPISSKVSTER